MLTVKEAYKTAFKIYRKNLTPLLFFSLVIGGVLALLQGYLINQKTVKFEDLMSKILFHTHLFPTINNPSLLFTAYLNSALIDVINYIIVPLIIIVPIISIICKEFIDRPISIKSEIFDHWKDVLFLVLILRVLGVSLAVSRHISINISMLIHNQSSALHIILGSILLEKDRIALVFEMFILSPVYYFFRALAFTAIFYENFNVFNSIKISVLLLCKKSSIKLWNYIVLNSPVLLGACLLYLFCFFIKTVYPVYTIDLYFVPLSRFFLYFLSPIIYTVNILLYQELKKSTLH